MIKEIKKLENEISNTFRNLFFKSNYQDWTCTYTGKTYKLMKDNLVIFLVIKEKGDKYINFNIYINIDFAKNSTYGSNNYHIVKYQRERRIGKILSFRYNKKFNDIIKFFNQKSEYEQLKSAYELLPIKLQRKGKLEKLNNVD